MTVQTALTLRSGALPAKVVEYRHQAKLKSTYVDALPLLAGWMR